MNHGKLFSRSIRLTDKRDFDSVFRHGRRSADRLFTVLYRETQLGYPRLGLAIAKKKVSRATRRNRLKRLIRESFRDVAGGLSGLDIVVMAAHAADTTCNPEVFASLDAHWRRLRAAKEG